MGFESSADDDAGDVLGELVAEITGDMVRVRFPAGTSGLQGGDPIVVVIDEERIMGSVVFVEDDEHATVLLDRVALSMEAQEIEAARRDSVVDERDLRVSRNWG